MTDEVEGDVRGRGAGDDVIRHSGGCSVLLVWPEESGDFAAYEAYEGAGKHLVGLPSGVLKVVVWVGQHIKKSLNQFFILRKEQTAFRRSLTHIYALIS